MGGFHIAQNFLKAIGHLMQGTGIEDIMVEANVCLVELQTSSSVGKTTTQSCVPTLWYMQPCSPYTGKHLPDG